MSNESQVADHPEQLGRLAPVFGRRRIVLAVDGEGGLVLLRPDSVVVDVGDDEDSFERGVGAIEKVFPKQGEAVRKQGRRRGGLARVEVPGVELAVIQGERRWSATPVQEVLSRLREAGATTEPNHVVLGSQIVRGVPVGGEAYFAGGMMFTADVIDTDVGPVLKTTSDPAPEPAWLRQPLGLGEPHRAPQILVLDTGLRTHDAKGAAVEHPQLTCARLHSPWMRNATVGAVDDEDEYDDDQSRTLDFEAGHGTFITGIIQQICPDAEVHVAGVLSSFGDGDVDTVVAAFERALTTAGPFDIVVMSLGGYMSDDDGGLFEAALGRLVGDGLGVAAAGNQSTSRPYFPAASPSIVGVGALGQADKAWFTNFGGWVDACAPGIDVVSTFFLGDPAGLDEAPFTGWARWSGTSFSAPKVAAVVAQEMYLTTSTPRDSWKRLSNYQRYRFPDLGIVFNV